MDNADLIDPHRQVELLSQQLKQAQRMASLGELVGTTTHEFNNILMTILNYSKLGMRHDEKETRDKAFQKILEAAQRAERLTNGVLGLARNRGTDRAPIELQPLVEESLLLLEREMRKYRVQVETDFTPAPPVMACGNQIQQVLINLMTNARQAMPSGGRLIIRIGEDSSTNTVDLTIRDTGQGIPPEKLQHIFDRFYTTKDGPDESGKGGTGVGLSTCKEIVDAHQGKIRVDSTEGVGTAFTIKLPQAATDSPANEAETIKLGLPVAS